jgi:hypothetical protein
MEDKKQEDLDMLYVLRSVKNGILNIVRSITAIFAFSLKNIKVLLLFIIISTALCLGIFFLQKPYYTSTLSISHIRVENDYCYQMIANLNGYIDNKSNSGLTQQLGLDRGMAEKIISIKFLPLNENIAIRFADSVSVMLPFKVKVEVYDNSILDSLQNKILNYLETNEYARTRKDLEKLSLEKTEKRVDAEIIEIDSLKRLVNQGIIPRSSGQGIILGEPIDPITIYKRGMDLYERKLLLDKKKLLNNSFELMVGFTKSPKSSNSGQLLYICIGILLGYVFGLLWLAKKQLNGSDK